MSEVLRYTPLARRLGTVFVLGTALVLLLVVVLRSPVVVGPVTVTPARLFLWWIVVGLAMAAVGFALEGIGAVKHDLGRGRRRAAVLQMLLSALAVAVVLYLALRAAFFGREP